MPVYAQTSTDAGILLQQMEQERQKEFQKREFPSSQAQSLSEKESTKSQLKVTVNRFLFVGNSLFSGKRLAVVVRRYLNHPVSYAQLEDAAAAVGEYYRQRGWTVRSFLPKQDIVGGVVTIQIVEAKFGKVQTEKESYRWPTQKKIEDMVAAQQKEGELLNARRLERVLLLLDDLPGVVASGRLQQGEKDGETDLVVKKEKEPLFSGMLITDNEGSRSTGYYRAHSFMELMNPIGIGDQSLAYVLYSKGLRFARFEETVPVGDNGWRIGANSSIVDYKVISSEFKTLNTRGNSISIGAQSSYPLMRTRQQNIYLDLNYDRKYFGNDIQGAMSSEYCVENYTTTIRSSMVDQFAGGGNTLANLSIIFGNLNLGTVQAGEDSELQGDFKKIIYSISRQQTIIPKVFVYSSFSGQISSEKKLDSSEKFYLGGPSGVRAYPVSEGSGVNGQLSKTELRWRFLPNYQLSGFFDYGRVINYGDVKSYNLKGAGMELVWQSKSGLSITLTWARRIGRNPNPTSTGYDQDGSKKRDRFWLSISLRF